MNLCNYSDFSSRVNNCLEIRNLISEYRNVIDYPRFIDVYLEFLDLGLKWTGESISSEIDLLTTDTEFAYQICNCMKSLAKFPYYGVGAHPINVLMKENGNYHLKITFPQV